MNTSTVTYTPSVEPARGTTSVRARVGPARVLSAIAAALTVGAGLVGLLVDGVYDDVPVVTAVARGSDLAAVIVGVPLLMLALAGSVRGSMRAHLAWLGMLAYLGYDYAYYVYDARFSDLFVVHVAILVASVSAIGLALIDLDAAAIGARFRPAALTRWISSLLMLLGGTIIVLWGYNSVRFAITDQEPTDVLPLPLDRVHLGYAIDLTLFGPVAVLTAVLLWRRTGWGYVLGVMVSLFAGVYQLNYLAGRYFAADVVANVPRYDWFGVALAAMLLAAAAVMLRNAPDRVERSGR